MELSRILNEDLQTYDFVNFVQIVDAVCLYNHSDHLGSTPVVKPEFQLVSRYPPTSLPKPSLTLTSAM